VSALRFARPQLLLAVKAESRQLEILMTINWTALATIAAPILALFVGVWVNRRFENRPVLLSWFGHVSAFTHHPPNGGPEIRVHTHSVVLRNAGRRNATNVRLHHTVLTDFNIWPPTQYHVESLPDGSKDIVVPSLVPNEAITVSYLYFPPVTYAQVNAGIKSDQGFAQEIPVLLQRVYPRRVTLAVVVVLFAGLVSILYLAYRVVVRLLQ
jgi:hypothetical protein